MCLLSPFEVVMLKIRHLGSAKKLAHFIRKGIKSTRSKQLIIIMMIDDEKYR
jgi:hypothetical protein